MSAAIDHTIWPRGGEDFGPCPYCPGKLGVLREGRERNVVASFHTEPTCKVYEDTDANAFLLGVLDIREASRRPPVQG